MWVTFALLVDDSTHNFMRKRALELEHAYRVGFRAALVSPHISLKQPFRAANLAAIEAYFDAFAAGIQPFDVMLEAVEVLPAAGPGHDMGIVWLAARESQVLRDLHDRLNIELAARFEHTTANFDGPAFRFHATVALGGQPPEVYQAIAASHGQPDLRMTCRIDRILLGCADDAYDPPGPFISYKILSLGKRS